MAKAPIYEPGQVKPRPLPGPRFAATATAEAFGAGAARQLGQVGVALEQITDTASKHIIAQQEKVNTALANEGLFGFREEVEKRLSEEVWSKKGSLAFDAYDRTGKIVAEARKKYVAMLKNERQKEMFVASADNDRVGHLGNAISFQTQQMDKFYNDGVMAGVLQRHRKAVASRNDPKMLVKLEKENENDIAAVLFGQGVAPLAVAEAVDKDRHAMYLGVLEAIKLDSSQAALGFYRANKSKFDKRAMKGEEELLIKKAEEEAIINIVETLSITDNSLEEQLDSVVTLVAGAKEAGLPISKRGVDEIKRGLKGKHREQQLLQKIREKNYTEGLYDAYFADPKSFRVPLTAPRAFKKHIDEMNKNALEKEAWLAGGGPKPGMVTNHNSKNKLMSMPLSELNALNKVTDEDWNKLDRGDWEDVFNHSKGDKKFLSVQTWNAQVKEMMDRTDLLTTGVRPGWARNLDDDGIETARAQCAELMAKEVQGLPEEERTPTKLREIFGVLMEDVEIKIPAKEELPTDPLGGLASPEGALLYAWRRRGETKQVKRFEVPFLSEEAQVAHAKGKLAQAPQSIRGIPGLQWHEPSRTYFAPVLDEIRIYAEGTGEWVDTYEASPNVSGVR